MSGFQCPYCSMIMSISKETHAQQTPSFNYFAHIPSPNHDMDESCVKINFFKCPNCGEYTINAIGMGKK